MAYLGLVPSERSSGDHVYRGGITKTGNSEARRMLVEAAWSYRYPPRVAAEKVEVLVRLPKPVRDIAWKCQVRLCERFRKLSRSGDKPTVVVTAIAASWRGSFGRSDSRSSRRRPERLARRPVRPGAGWRSG